MHISYILQTLCEHKFIHFFDLEAYFLENFKPFKNDPSIVQRFRTPLK